MGDTIEQQLTMTLEEMEQDIRQAEQDKADKKPLKFILCPECKGNLLECQCWLGGE